MSTTWTNETAPGGSWTAGQVGITAGATQDTLSNLIVYMGSLGLATVWAYEDKP